MASVRRIAAQVGVSVATVSRALNNHPHVDEGTRRRVVEAAEKKFKVACQMGNQGHSEANYFQFKAWTEAGIIKNVTQITAFMNNPRRWHGMKVDGYLPEQPIPNSLDWDCWLATALEHKYNKGYLNGWIGANNVFGRCVKVEP